ncbi:MAG: extracellular solute-binding protein [Clostridia bacterium]|nr:extracellular solute-binding protein [Clostridia bacterium]
MSAKKLFALALALLMAVSTVACGNKEPATAPATTPATTAPATVPSADPDSYHAKYGLPDVDFSGKTLELVDAATGWATSASLEGDHNQVARFEMLSAFMEETGAELLITPSATSTQFSEAQPIVMAGSKYGDIMLNAAWTLGEFYMADILAPMNDLKYLNTSKDYWDKSLLESLTVMDELLGVGGDIAPVREQSWMLFFNKTIAEELQLPDLYQMVRDGDWTFDKFIEYCEMAVKDNGDNVWDSNDRYGVASAPACLEQALFYGMGGYFYNVNELGQYYCATLDKRNREITDLILRDIRDNNIAYNVADWGVTVNEMFPTDRLLFVCYVPNAGSTLWAEMVNDYGVLPMPKMNKDQKDYYQTGEQAVITFFCSKNGDQQDLVGYFLEFCGAYGNDVLQSVIDTYYETRFRDDASLEMFHIATAKPYFERVTLMLANSNFDLFGPAQSTFNITVQTPGASISSYYESTIDAANLRLAELFGY